MMTSLDFILILVALVIWVISLYNRIIKLEDRYGNTWSQIDVQLKRRTDLLPNLAEPVKRYAAHEKGVFEEVAASRSAMMNAKTVAEPAEAANQMSSALGRLMAVSEAYPELKANQNFMMLQEELSSVENKIAYARQFYNDAVLQFNNAVTTVPGVLLAGPMGKKTQVFLEIPETERQAPSVSFS